MHVLCIPSWTCFALFFASVGGDVNVRMMTKRGSNEPRGCAFVEFDNAVSQSVSYLLKNWPHALVQACLWST